jgi:glucose-6-phosphatase
VDEQNMGPTLQFVSRLGSPEFAFTLAFPLLYALHWSVGIRFLGVAIVSEWLNMILKW